MSDFLLQHHHDPSECESAFAAWRSFDSPLRGSSAPSTCLAGGHRIWWLVEAPMTKTPPSPCFPSSSPRAPR